MKHSIFILFFCLLLTGNSGAANAYSGGDGSAMNPYLISSVNDYDMLATEVSNGETYAGKYFELHNKLSVSVSIGNPERCFSGVFEGNGYEIALNNAPYGVFAYLDNATVRNLGVTGIVQIIYSEEGMRAGSIAAYADNHSTIKNCYSKADIKAWFDPDRIIVESDWRTTRYVHVGGICGCLNNYSTISDCFSHSDLDIVISIIDVVDPHLELAGSMWKPVGTNSFPMTTHTPVFTDIFYGYTDDPYNAWQQVNEYKENDRGSINLGGICGTLGRYCKITNCYFSATGNDWSSMALRGLFPYGGRRGITRSGGICGYSEGSVENCFTTNSSIDGLGSRAGRIVAETFIRRRCNSETDRRSQYASIYTTDPEGRFLHHDPMGIEFFYDGIPPTDSVYTRDWIGGTGSNNYSSLKQSRDDGRRGNVEPIPNFDWLHYSQVWHDINWLIHSYPSALIHDGQPFILQIEYPEADLYEELSLGTNATEDQFKSRDFIKDNLKWDTDKIWIFEESPALPLLNFTPILTTLLQTPGGAISPVWSFTKVERESVQSFTITADPNYRIKELSINGDIYTDAKNKELYTYSFTARRPVYEIKVSFALPEYTITTSTTGHGKITETPTVKRGDDQTITFTPDAGYEIDEVWVNGEVDPIAKEEGYYTFVDVTEDHEIKVSFKTSQYSIIFTKDGSGTRHVVEYGSSLTFDFTPEEGYEVASLIIDGIAEENAHYFQTYTFRDISASHSIEVAFKRIEIPLNVYVTDGGTVKYDGGTVRYGEIPVSDDHLTYFHRLWFYQGDSVTFTFTPDENYKLGAVIVDREESESAQREGYYVFRNIDRSLDLRVWFEKVGNTITASASDGGAITPSGVTEVDYDSWQAYTFTPDTGYEIEEVLVNGLADSIAKECGYYTFENVKEDQTISVVFKRLHYKLSLSSNIGGRFTKEDGSEADTLIAYGEYASYIFKPADGYEISAVLIDGVENPKAALSGFYAFPPIVEPHSIEVIYSLKQYKITSSTAGNGAIEPEGDLLVSHGDGRMYYFIPEEGYVVESVLIDGVENPKAALLGFYTFPPIVESHSIHVVFSPKQIVTEVKGKTGGTIVTDKDSTTFIFTPEEGYEIDTVFINGEIDTQAREKGVFEAQTDKSYEIVVSFKPVVTTGFVQVQNDVRSVSIYPNPTSSGAVTLKSATLKAGDKITVVNAAGVTVRYYTATASATALDISTLPAGIYFVNVKGQQVKLVKFD
jgi:hypothetical protein